MSHSVSLVETDDWNLTLLYRHRNSGGSVDMSDESESETDSSLADDESNGQVRRRSSTTSKKRRWLKEEVIAYLLLRRELWFWSPEYLQLKSLFKRS